MKKNVKKDGASIPIFEINIIADLVFSPEDLLRERDVKISRRRQYPGNLSSRPGRGSLPSIERFGGETRPALGLLPHDLYVLETPDEKIGVVGCAVGAFFRRTGGEELFASGCRLLITSLPPARSNRRAILHISCSSIAPYATRVRLSLSAAEPLRHYPEDALAVGQSVLNALPR